MSSGQVVPARLTQARELAGQTKTQVAQALQVSGAAVTQWESGGKRPTHENLAALSRHLDVPLTLFFRDLPVALNSRGPLSFRAWQSAGTRQANRKATRLAELTAEIFAWLDERVTLPAPVLPPPLGEQGGGVDAEVDVEAAAKLTRQTWGLGEAAAAQARRAAREPRRPSSAQPPSATSASTRSPACSAGVPSSSWVPRSRTAPARASTPRTSSATWYSTGTLDAGELREPAAHALAEAQSHRFRLGVPAASHHLQSRRARDRPAWLPEPQAQVGRVRAEHGGAGT